MHCLKTLETLINMFLITLHFYNTRIYLLINPSLTHTDTFYYAIFYPATRYVINYALIYTLHYALTYFFYFRNFKTTGATSDVTVNPDKKSANTSQFSTRRKPSQTFFGQFSALLGQISGNQGINALIWLNFPALLFYLPYRLDAFPPHLIEEIDLPTSTSTLCSLLQVSAIMTPNKQLDQGTPLTSLIPAKNASASPPRLSCLTTPLPCLCTSTRLAIPKILDLHAQLRTTSATQY